MLAFLQVVSAFLLISIIFVPIGVACLLASHDVRLRFNITKYQKFDNNNSCLFCIAYFFCWTSILLLQVVEIIDQYETECVPENLRGDKLAFIQDPRTEKTCTRVLIVRFFIFIFLALFQLCFYFWEGIMGCCKDRQQDTSLRWNLNGMITFVVFSLLGDGWMIIIYLKGISCLLD